MSSGTNVLLLLTDKDTGVVSKAFETLKEGGGNQHPAYILFHRKGNALPNSYRSDDTFVFTDKSVFELNYIPISKALIPGSNHFPVLQFFLKHPGYDYYWVVEDDVRFNGHWTEFFQSFAGMDHDFISCHLRRYEQEPAWFWWRTLIHPEVTVPVEERIRSFNPIYRLSNRALRFLHQALSDQWIGHHEVLIPTLLHREGMSILDFGGEGHFVAEHLEKRFYTSGSVNDGKDLTVGTMRHRPIWPSMGTEKNMLYHPIKE